MFFMQVDEWYSECVQGQLSENTCRCYRLAISHIKKYGKNIPLKEVEEIDLQEILNRMAAKNFAKSTIDKVRIVLKNSFALAFRKKKITSMPFISLKIPRTASVKKVEALTKEQQKSIEALCRLNTLEHCQETLFLLNTGLRISELCNLLWENYYVENERTYIKIAKSKTASGERIVPLNTVAKTIIENQPHINKYVFNCKSGHPISSTMMSKHNKRIKEILKIDNFTNHICRHSFATRCLENGMNIRVLSKLLGHKSVAFTMQRYTTIFEDLLFEQIKFLD